MAADETLPAEPAPAPVAAAATDAGATLASWERYDVGEELGRGGMGVVYRARDRRLDRPVALKLIRGGDPNLTVRLVREARAQARIDHPNVCRVYEVGEVGGRAYIALQLVAGEPLSRVAAQLSLDEKVGVARDIALAIHEAHRLGIVHRDLKPANVLVEHADDGRWIPIVMDFGLARETTLEVGLTETGALLGTPAYMSPEQARGDTHAIDRRSDVYSLGATLYELLVGRPPFSSTSLAIALAQVINDDPPAPKRLVPALPVDLETITLKCLAKEPDARYASARALADDLARYLEGESILGRRPSLVQRLRSSVRRHRLLYGIAALSSVLVIAAGALGIRSYLASRDERARGADRAQLAERLGRDAKDIELLLHAAYELPLHDTRKERAVIRARMTEIEATRHDLGPLGDAVIHDALGRGHLALHEWQGALDELGHAADAGLDTPELHAARGRALGELYHRAMEEARRSGDRTWLAARERDLEAQYLAPALKELAAGRTASGDTGALLDALVALYRRDYAAAERGALAIAEASPWVYEARGLAADAAYAAGAAAVDRGDYDAARGELDRAHALYTQALDVARSDATLYEAAAHARLLRADLDDRQRKPLDQPLADAVTLIDHSTTADPESAVAFTTKAYILSLRARTASSDGADVVTAAERAVALDPKDAGAWDALGNAHIARGEYEKFHDGNGEPWWRQALVDLARALAIRPNDPWANNDVGVAHGWLAESVDERGGDPLPEMRAALAAQVHSTEIDPGYAYGWTNQVTTSADIAEFQAERGLDATASIDAAVNAGKRSLDADPSLEVPLRMMARAELVRAGIALQRGGDPRASIAAVRGYLDRANKLRPDGVSSHRYRAQAARFEASMTPATRVDAIGRARVEIVAALQLGPTEALAWVERAEIELVAGDLANAQIAADKAIELEDSYDARVVGAAIAHARHDEARTRRDIERALAFDPAGVRARALRDATASSPAGRSASDPGWSPARPP